jgi:cytochrome c556
MKKFALALAATATLAALPAAAQFQKPEDAIKYRQSAFTVMANHFSRIGAMAQGRVPFDAATAASNAEIVAMMSRLPFAGFVDGSQGGKAKAEIWSDRDKFNAAAAKMQEEAGKLAAAARSGNADQVRAGLRGDGGQLQGLPRQLPLAVNTSACCRPRAPMNALACAGLPRAAFRPPRRSPARRAASSRSSSRSS